MTPGDGPVGPEEAGPRLSPTGEPAAPEQVGLAIRSIGIGILAGACLTTMALWGARLVQAGAPPTGGTGVSGSAFLLVVGGTFGGMALAAILTWLLLRPVASTYRRGGFSMVAGFGTVLAFLPTVVADRLGGPWGMLGYAALCAAGSFHLSRRLSRESAR